MLGAVSAGQYDRSVRYVDAMSSSVRSTSKSRHYPAMYDMIAATLPPAPTILEIGIANGGSLETWRKVLGPDARIIGVDLNPRARVLEDEGFEVLLLDSGLESSWDHLREILSHRLDLLVDDGGHTNRQQIAAVLRGIDLVKDGGWLVVEDLHASYMGEFGNPNPYSTSRFLAELASDLHRRHPRSETPARHPNLAAAIQYMVTAPSLVALRITSEAGGLDEISFGTDQTLMDYDHRWDSAIEQKLTTRVPHPITRAFHNRYVGFVGSLAGRRLFRRDAGPRPNDG
jgi:hypothetical protein